MSRKTKLPKKIEMEVVSIDLCGFVAAAFDEAAKPAEEIPTTVIIMGDLAAGKTTLRKAKYTHGYVVVDAVAVFLRLCMGKELDFPGALEEPMQLIGQMITDQAIAERRNIVTEVIPVRPHEVKALIEALKGRGYQTHLVCVTCSLEEGQHRNSNRGPDDISAYFAEQYQISWLLDACRNAAV